MLLQLAIELQRDNSSVETSSLRKPDVVRTLSFIKLSLDHSIPSEDETHEGKGLSLDSLKINKEPSEAQMDEEYEDLALGLEGVDPTEHMSVTAVNLLLALLQGIAFVFITISND